MLELRQGTPEDAAQLSDLVLSSAPVLLPYLFGSASQARQFVYFAMRQEDGQYSAVRHCVATKDGLAQGPKVIGCVTLWHTDLPEKFHSNTLSSLASFLSSEQVRRLLTINPLLTEVFAPPASDELCIGHLAVESSQRGKGVGKELLAYAKRQANSLNKVSLVLDVDAKNDEALRFYAACDFTQHNITYFEPSKQSFYRMRYML